MVATSSSVFALIGTSYTIYPIPISIILISSIFIVIPARPCLLHQKIPPSNSPLPDIPNKYGSCICLTPTNFSRWLSDIELMLMAGDLYNIATGTEQAPPPAAQNASTTSRAYIDDQSYRKRHRECWMTIYNSITESLQVRFRHFVRDADPAGMWTSAIQNMDTTQHHVSSGRPYSDFFAEQWKPTDNLQTWISRLEDYRDKLSASPTHQINDAMMVTKAVTNLPVEWSMTRQEIW